MAGRSDLILTSSVCGARLSGVEAGHAGAVDITDKLGLVRSIAIRFQGRGLDLEDLIQEGAIGLLAAARRYDSSRAQFSTFATLWIRQSIQRAVDNQGSAIRVPVHLADNMRRLHAARAGLTVALGREPTIGELAEATGLDEDAVRRAGSIPKVVTTTDAPSSVDGPTLLETVVDDAPDPADLATAGHHRLEPLLGRLTDQERMVLVQRLGLDGDSATLEEIGSTAGVTRERIRQIEAKALSKLRHPSSRPALDSAT